MRRLLTWFIVPLLGLIGATATTGAPAARELDTIRVVSLNLAMREDVERIVSDLAAVGAADTSDLVLLQEVVQRERRPSVSRQLGERLGLDSMFREAFTLDDGRSVGLAVLSRHPWHDVRVIELKRFDLGFRSRTRIALVAAVNTPAGRILVSNVHLDSRINLDQRLDQLAAVVSDVQAFDGPAVVAGDFNTNNNRWIFHTIPFPFIERQAAGLRGYMERTGFSSAFDGSSPTHDALGMQLDWVFVRGLQASAASVYPVGVSDHHALLVSLAPVHGAL